MDMALNRSPLLAIQVLNRKAAMHQMLEGIATDMSTNTGYVVMELENMVIAKVYPSTERFDYIQAGGITKNQVLGAVECKANKYYPEDAEPVANPFNRFWKPKGQALPKNEDDAEDAEDKG